MKTKAILFSALAAATLASCSNDDNLLPEAGSGKANFSAIINGQPQSRAFDQTWEDGDHIGISCVTGEKTYTNVDYRHDNGGNFTVNTEGSEIYYQSDDVVNFTAYYPWTDLHGVTTIAADTHNQADQKNFDFLHATATGSKARPNVAFAFNHKMTKLVLTVKKGADVSIDEVKQAVLSLGGFVNDGEFDVVTGSTSVEGKTACTGWVFSDVTTQIDNGDETVSYSLILFPQEFAKKLPFTATLTGKQSFTAELDFTAANSDTGINAWVAGRQYNMSVTLHKTGITVDGCTIIGWDEQPGGNFDAN